MNPRDDIPEQSPAQLRSFGLIFGALIAVIFGLLIPWLFSGGYRWWPWAAGAVFAIWALAHPASLRPVYRVWMRFGLVIGFINTRIIMAILFYGLFLPIGFVMRLFGWDAMHRQLSGKVESYRVVSRKPRRDHMSHPF